MVVVVENYFLNIFRKLFDYLNCTTNQKFIVCRKSYCCISLNKKTSFLNEKLYSKESLKDLKI